MRPSKPFKLLVALVSVVSVGALALSVASLRATAHDAERAEFFNVVGQGSPEEAEQFLARGFSPNEREPVYEPSRPFFQQLQILASRGLRSNLGEPLLYAAMNNRKHRLPMMRLLLDRGARVDLGDDETSLVNYAVSTGDSAAVRLLIERGAKVPADEWPVARALWRPDADLVSLLIQHGGAVPKDCASA